MSTAFIISQFIGSIAVLISLSIFQVNKRQKMLKLSVMSTLLYTLHFSLLGAYTGAAMNLLSGVRSYTFLSVKPSQKYRAVLYLFITLLGIATYLTWQGVISLLAFSGASCATFAMWHAKPKYIRRWAMLASPLWFIYNAYVGSYPGMAVEVIMFTSNLLGQYRFDLKKTVVIKRS